MNPKAALAPAPRAPFHGMFVAVTEEPLDVTDALHDWAMPCPSGNVQDTVQPLTALVPAVTVTSPWNPPGHWLITR